MENQENQQSQPTQTPPPQPFGSMPGTEPSTQPPVITPPVEPVFSAPQTLPAPKSKKGLVIGIIIAAVLLVLGAGGYFAYAWYQNPEKVVTDGIMNAIQAKSMTFSAMLDSTKDSAKTKVTLSGNTKDGQASLDFNFDYNNDSTTYSIKGATVVDSKGDLYFKIKNAKDLADKLLSSSTGQLPAKAKTLLNDFVAKVNDKWIKISADDLKTYSADAAKSQTCVQKAAESFRQDKAATTEVSDLYAKHKFITIGSDLGSKDGSFGYELKSDSTKAREFSLGLRDTKIYKQLHDCDARFTIDEKDLTVDNNKSTDTTKVQLWVSQWSHEITKFSATGTESGDATTLIFEPKFNQAVSIETPANSQTLKDLTDDFKDLTAAISKEVYSGTYKY